MRTMIKNTSDIDSLKSTHIFMFSALVFIFSLFYPCLSHAEYSYTQLYEGSAADKMTIIWIPSGFTADQKDTFKTKAGGVTNDMWDVNWFQDHKEYFEVYRLDGDDGTEDVPVWDADGQKKSQTEIRNIIKALPNN